MSRKKNRTIQPFSICNGILMILLAALCTYPIYHVVVASVSNPTQLMQHQGLLLKPYGFTLNGYQMVFQNPNILTGYMNTIIYVLAGTVINVFLLIIGAFVLSRRTLLIKSPLSFFIAFTMFFSGGLIPYYIVVQELGMVNTRWALILPGAINVWNLIVTRTSFQAIPDSLEEAAKIDGCGDLRLLYRIIVPLSMPVLAVMILFSAVGHWNAWFDAAIFLQNRELFPLQLILREILINNDTTSMTANQAAAGVSQMESGNYRQLVQYCVVVIATLPILCIYPFLQKYFVKGVMVGAIKG